MATHRKSATRPSAAGEAADQELVNVLRNTIHAKVLANLDHIVDEAVQSAIVEASKVPEDRGSTAPLVLSGHTKPTTRPKEGGVCAAVWETLDKMRADGGSVPTLDQVRKVAKRRRWNANNARIEYYRWRAFNDIRRNTASASPEVRA